MKELIDDATPHQVAELFTRFYAGEEGTSEDDLARLRDQLVAKIEAEIAQGLRASMAAVQGHFIRTNARDAVAGWSDLVRMAKEDATARQKFASSP